MKKYYTRREIISLKNRLISLVNKLNRSNMPANIGKYVAGLQQEIVHYDTVIKTLNEPDDRITDEQLCSGFNETMLLITEIENSLGW